PLSSLREISKPASRNTASMAVFSCMTSATNRSMPCSAARCASCSSRRVAQANVFGDGDDSALERADEDAVRVPVRYEIARDEVRVDPAHAVEAQVDAPGREAGEERDQVGLVVRAG